MLLKKHASTFMTLDSETPCLSTPTPTPINSHASLTPTVLLCFAANDLPPSPTKNDSTPPSEPEALNNASADGKTSPSTPPKSTSPVPSTPAAATPVKAEVNGSGPEPSAAERSKVYPDLSPAKGDADQVNNSLKNNSKHVEELYDIPPGKCGLFVWIFIN